MKIDNGISRKEVAANVMSYILGVVTVAVVCCGTDVLEAVEYGHAQAASTDEGDVQVLSTVSFVFYEGIEDIVNIQASAYVNGLDVKPLNDYKLYRTEEMLVVELETQKGYTTHFVFLFINGDGEEVAMFKAEALIDQSLITYHDMHFGDKEKVLNHTQSFEVEIMDDESIDVPLGKSMTVWSNGRFHNVRRLVSKPNDSSIGSSDCTLQNFQPSNSVGIISDGTEGEIVHLEVLLP